MRSSIAVGCGQGLAKRIAIACAGIAGMTLLVAPERASAQERTTANSVAASQESGFDLPYAFWNSNFGLSAGYIDVANGYPQPQASLFATVLVGAKGSAFGYLSARDLDLLGSQRLLVDSIGSVGYFNEIDAYIGGNSKFEGQRAGANGSNRDNFVRGNGWDNFLRVRFKYLLPIGNGVDQIMPDYHVVDGLLVDGATGGQSYNPLTSGRSFLQVQPFYRTESLKGEPVSRDLSTNGLDARLVWDNRDFPDNPSCGNSLTLQVSRDFGILSSSSSWTDVSIEYDHYFSFGETAAFRQRTLALDFWTSNSPSWHQETNGMITHGPPPYAGGSLGGLFRMRAYPTERFSDKAAIYSSAELRVIPAWNPFTAFPRFQEKVGVAWIQLVALAEAGRVGPSWTAEALDRNLKWDAGFGIRVWAKGLVVRIDTAFGNEGVGAQMMVSQPFQF